MKPLLPLIFFLLWSCGNDQENLGEDWNGSQDMFEDSFELKDQKKGLSRPLLIETASGKPFSGNINRNEDGLSTQQSFTGGLLNGKSIKTSVDGSWVEANYLNGQLDGEMTFYDADGKIRSVMVFSEGKLVTPPSDQE